MSRRLYLAKLPRSYGRYSEYFVTYEYCNSKMRASICLNGGERANVCNLIQKQISFLHDCKEEDISIESISLIST